VKDYTQHSLGLQAQEILRGAQFEIARVALPSSESAVIVAENYNSVAALAAVDEWSEIRSEVGQIATDFANWAYGREPREKQWDLYLVVLVSTPVTDNSDLTEIEQVAADTRYVRRLVRNGVSSVDDGTSLQVALAALLPLSLPARVLDRDPHMALTEALRSNGVDSETAERTVQRFQEQRNPAQ
jgi:hypothetical protein